MPGRTPHPSKMGHPKMSLLRVNKPGPNFEGPRAKPKCLESFEKRSASTSNGGIRCLPNAVGVRGVQQGQANNGAATLRAATNGYPNCCSTRDRARKSETAE